jgi:small-conductance mechanosensitive channel
METLGLRAQQIWSSVSAWLTSPAFYLQLVAIAAAIGLAFLLAVTIRSRISELRVEPEPGPWLAFRRFLFEIRSLVFPILNVLLLGIAADVTLAFVDQVWLIRVSQSLAVVFLLYTIVTRFIGDWLITSLLKWIGIPLATLHVFGWLDDVTSYLDSLAFRVGNIEVSVYDIGRTIFFGIILFWLGRISNTTGKRAIRSNPNLDIGTREVAVKLFEIGLFVVLSFILLNIMGVNLTALTVFGGAFGIGLGLGLQRIAANFISGIIILLDRSITIGDYIELADGHAGRLRELNMRFATLETFDGKDIVVPNETFVSESFINWTHFDTKQRYSVEFSVAYDTDIPALLEIVRNVTANHPSVLNSPAVSEFERPEAEIKSFGDSGIDIEVEFWIQGIDDGPNSVRADLMLMIWTACRERGIEMPFPQREVRILKE